MGGNHGVGGRLFDLSGFVGQAFPEDCDLLLSSVSYCNYLLFLFICFDGFYLFALNWVCCLCFWI